MTLHIAYPLDRDSAVFSRCIRKGFRASFWAAQGNQVLQVHFLQAYARYMVIDRIPRDPTARHIQQESMREQLIPHGHVQVLDKVRRAQNEFWWQLMWDILDAAYDGVPECLPSRAELDDRIRACGGDPTMSGFSDEQMTPLARALGLYRRRDIAPGPNVVIELLFLPGVIEVERGFQGAGVHYPQRPRTDGGDVHQSRLASYCQRACVHYHEGTADIVDRIYRMLCERLTWLAAARIDDPVHIAYRELVDAYNTHHRGQHVEQLHVSAADFPAGYRSGSR